MRVGAFERAEREREDRKASEALLAMFVVKHDAGHRASEIGRGFYVVSELGGEVRGDVEKLRFIEQI